MKTYEGFLLEGVGDRLGKMSDEDFAQFQKGRSKEEAEHFRATRDKARGKTDNKPKDNKPSGKKVNKPGGSIVVRKTTKDRTSPGRSASSAAPAGGVTPTKSPKSAPKSAGVTGGLGPKSRSSNAPSVEPKKKRETIHRYVPRTVIPQKDELEKKKKEKELERRRKKGKGLNLGIGDKLATAASELAKTETNKDVQTYEAKPVA